MIPWDSTFMEMAETVAKRSTCIRVQVGCVIVKDRRVISMGYNGAPSGLIHCNTYFADKSQSTHREFSSKWEVHAEANAIGWAARYGISTEGTTLYTTISPCLSCAKLIIAAGIKNVIYKYEYDRVEDDGRVLLEIAQINAQYYSI